MELKEYAKTVYLRLLDFYGYPQLGRPFPPIDQLVSTILSQNTNDKNRDRAFNALRRCFSTWEAVRDADVKEIIQAIRPAGLANQKGPRIQNSLRRITELRGELNLDFLADLPIEESRQWLMDFEGVGPKTAAIVLLFSFGRPSFPVDTHIYRVTGRVGLLPQKMSAEQAHQYLSQLLPAETFYAAHLNLIRLGREICHPRRPECQRCPVADLCAYYDSANMKKHLTNTVGENADVQNAR